MTDRDKNLEKLQEHLDTATPLTPELEAALEADEELRTVWAELCALEDSLQEGLAEEEVPADMEYRIMARLSSEEEKSGVNVIKLFWFPVAAAAALMFMTFAVRQDVVERQQDAKPSTTNQVAISDIDVLPNLNISETFREPKEKLREQGRTFVESTENIFKKSVSLLPSLPETETPKPAKDSEGVSAVNENGVASALG